MSELTPDQKELQKRIRNWEADIKALNIVLWRLKEECYKRGHVYEKDGDSATCVICENDGGWWCPISEKHYCEYDNSPYCIYCGEPIERK